MITIAYYFIIIILLFSGVGIISYKERRFNNNNIYIPKGIWDYFLKSFKDNNNVFAGTGYSLSRSKYESIRLGLLLFSFISGILYSNFFIIISITIIYLLSIPFDRLNKFVTPFGWVKSKIKKIFCEKRDMEIYQSITLLRNMIMVDKSSKLNTDYMIEQLAIYSELLRHSYFKMLNLLRLNKRQEAIQSFSSEIGTKTSVDFGRLLIQLDNLESRELEEILISLQKNIREERITKLKKSDETLSDILYLPVVINVLVIFINFIYVSYFINQKNIFSTIIN